MKIEAVERSYAVDEQQEEYIRSRLGDSWESFCIYDLDDPSEPDMVFEGATKLPDRSVDAMWDTVQHWCAVLTEIRQVIPDADWHVHVDDHDIPWDSAAGKYDPSQ
ncbi:MAG TPA: hypothetical protein VMY42_26280 [Thermoguttaceae bacterium]|nr:hypothetical protein [Thermoguttaceae bacterium]